MTDEDNAATGHRPFAAFLHEHRNGSLHAELSDTLAELAAAALEHAKPGQLTITLSVKPNADGVTVLVTDTVKANIPVPDRGASIYFADEDGNLSRRDPRQPELPGLRAASTPPNANANERTA